MKLVESILTRNPCYTAGRKIAVKGLMLHSVGCNQPKASVFINSWNSPSYSRACVHGFIDALDGTAYQTLPWDHRGWHCASGSKGSGNNTHVGVEMCEPACIKYTGGANFTCSDLATARACATRTYETAVELFAMLCGKFNLDPLADGVIISHAEGYKRGIASNHGDPEHLWKGLKMSYTMNGFRQDVKKAMESSASPAPEIPAAPATPEGTADTSDTDKTVWDTLFAAIGNAYGTAGLMGNLYAESALKPANLQNTGNKKLDMTDEAYTAAVDSGAYAPDAFIHDGYGYGLAQWTYYSRKAALLAHAMEQGKSIGDLAMQLSFLLKEIKGYSTVWSTLVSAESIRAASDIVLTKYERPADQSEAVQAKRAGYGQTYFDKYASAPGKDTADDTTETTAEDVASVPAKAGCYASAVIAVAIAEIGYKEKASNKNLDDKTANAGSANYTKYARDFDQKWPNWYNGKKNGFAWCDMFVDWCFLTAFGYDKALSLLCQPEKSAGAGCKYSLRYYKNKGRYYASGPKPGDQIFFGTSLDDVSHTGIVEKADSSKVYTIEGNTSDQVARRSYALTNSRIVGYGRPAYDAEGSTSITVSPADPAPTPTVYYRVRKSWEDRVSQIGAYTVLQNAKNCVDANPGFAAFDEAGNQVYPAILDASQTPVPYLVRISIDDLNIRKGPGTDFKKTGKFTGKGIFTIVEEASGKGSVKGFGRLKSGAGWVSLDYCEKL